MIPNQIRQSEAQLKRFIDSRRTNAGIMDNRMTMREGAEAIVLAPAGPKGKETRGSVSG